MNYSLSSKQTARCRWIPRWTVRSCDRTWTVHWTILCCQNRLYATAGHHNEPLRVVSPRLDNKYIEPFCVVILVVTTYSVMLCYRVNLYCLYSWTELVWNVKKKERHSACMYSSVSLHWKASCCFARILHWNSPCCLYSWILHWNSPCCLYRCILHWDFRAVSIHRICTETVRAVSIGGYCIETARAVSTVGYRTETVRTVSTGGYCTETVRVVSTVGYCAGTFVLSLYTESTMK